MFITQQDESFIKRNIMRRAKDSALFLYIRFFCFETKRNKIFGFPLVFFKKYDIIELNALFFLQKGEKNG